jgi:putative ABC transport system permease protein
MLGVSMSMASLSVANSISQYSSLIAFVAVMSIVISMVTINQSVSAAAQASKKDYALLLAVGSSPLQVKGIVFMQSLALSCIGAVIGVWTGYRVSVLSSSILVLTGSSVQLHPEYSWSTAILCGVIGVVSTLMASFQPARQAVTSDFDDASIDSRPIAHQRLYYLLSGLSLVLSIPLAWYAITTHRELSAYAMAVTLSAGVYMLYPLVFSWCVKGIERVIHWTRPGIIAMKTMTTTIRTSSTMSIAYSVSIILVAVGSVLASATAATLHTKIDESLVADTVVYPYDSSTMTVEDVQSLQSIKGVKSSAYIRGWKGSNAHDGSEIKAFISSSNVFDVAFKDAKASTAFKKGSVVAGKNLANKNQWKIGSKVTVAKDHKKLTLTIGYISSTPMVSNSLIVPEGGKMVSDITAVYLQLDAHGSDYVDSVMRSIVKAHPTYWVLNKADVINGYTYPIYENLLVFYALVSLVITISFFGLIASAVLSIMRRSKEIAVLMAAGMSKMQVRSMLAWQSAVTTGFGGLIGTGLGIGIGYVLAMSSGLDLGFPAVQLVWLVFVSILFGVAASLPAGIAVTKHQETRLLSED